MSQDTEGPPIPAPASPVTISVQCAEDIHVRADWVPSTKIYGQSKTNKQKKTNRKHNIIHICSSRSFQESQKHI